MQIIQIFTDPSEKNLFLFTASCGREHMKLLNVSVFKKEYATNLSLHLYNMLGLTTEFNINAARRRYYPFLISHIPKMQLKLRQFIQRCGVLGQ